jgi:competence protein ComGF
VRLWNERGFTLIEMLIAFLVFLMLVTAFPMAMRVILNDRVNEGGLQYLEWEIFSSQVKKEVRTAEQMTVSPDSIFMRIGQNTIIYDKYGTNIRRRVNLKGYEILMQNLTGLKFENIPEGVEISATNKYGDQYMARIQRFISIGEAE